MLDLLAGERPAARSLVVTDLNAQRPQFNLGRLLGARHVTDQAANHQPDQQKRNQVGPPPACSLGRLRREFLALIDRLFDGPNHVEGGFRQVIILAFAESLEAFDGVLQIDQLAGGTGEHFRDVERL